MICNFDNVATPGRRAEGKPAAGLSAVAGVNGLVLIDLLLSYQNMWLSGEGI
jgi:hypothetical protein